MSTTTTPQGGFLRGKGFIKPAKSVYTPEQISQYLARIGFPNPPSAADVEAGKFDSNWSNLNKVVVCHNVTVPFENASMHYDDDHFVDVDATKTFERVVSKKLGGSWCCGHNTLLLNVLRGLGYRCYVAVGRVNCSPAPQIIEYDWTTYQHSVILLQMGAESRETYLVDVGKGGAGLARPMPLVDGAVVKGGAAPEEHKLIRWVRPDATLTSDDGSHLEWAVQHTCGDAQPGWRTLYQFSDIESYPEDWRSNSFALNRDPNGKAPFWWAIMVTKFFFLEGQDTLEKDGDMGRLILIGDKVKKREGVKGSLVKSLSSEQERIDALKELFEITVSSKALENMKGRPPALVSPPPAEQKEADKAQAAAPTPATEKKEAEAVPTTTNGTTEKKPETTKPETTKQSDKALKASRRVSTRISNFFLGKQNPKPVNGAAA